MSMKAPTSIEEARKFARLKADHAAPVWDMKPTTLKRRCLRGEVPSAVKVGRIWYVTPEGMDRMGKAPKKPVVFGARG